MIERSSKVQIYNANLPKGQKGRLVRVAPEGFYEVTIEHQGRNYAALLPIADTVILSMTPEEEAAATIEVER
jgi:hypothetical protein